MVDLAAIGDAVTVISILVPVFNTVNVPSSLILKTVGSADAYEYSTSLSVRPSAKVTEGVKYVERPT